jgi:hypothetical protein
MATPKVFVSSTCYDLRYIRENIKYFIRTIGYEPILSEEGSVFYDPRIHVQDACIAEIPNCQLFILIIGGRFGSKFKDTDDSVTNSEYREAVRLKIPIFALVEQSVYNDFYLYITNKNNDDIDETKIKYPSSDSTKIFDFIDEVRSNTVNNALVPFRDFNDMESYLRQQWAGMMFSFLTKENEDSRVADTLSMLRDMNARVEMLSRQILNSVGTENAKLTAELYDAMLKHECVRDMSYWGLRPTPAAVLKNTSFKDCIESQKFNYSIDDYEGSSIGSNGTMSNIRFESDSKEYTKLRKELIKILEGHNLSIKEYLEQAKAA